MTIYGDHLRSALYLDFDNLFTSLSTSDPDLAMTFAQTPEEWCARLAASGPQGRSRWFSVRRCYMNPAGWVRKPNDETRTYFSKFRPFFTSAGFDVIDCPSLTQRMKNAADMRIALDVMDLLQAGFGVDEVIVASGDSDFTPLLTRLRMRHVGTYVITGGDAARAYTSVADGHMDENDLAELVVGKPADAFAGSEEEALEALVALVQRLLDESDGQVLLSHVGLQAHERFKQTIQDTRWFGQKTLAGALRDRFALTPYYVYDPERVEAPADTRQAEADEAASTPIGPAGRADAREAVPEIVVAVEKIVGMPRLTADQWRVLLGVLADYSELHSFNLTECTAWARDRMADAGVPTGRQSVAWVVRGATFGGAALTVPQSARSIATAVVANTLRLADNAQMDVSADDRRTLATYLGLEPVGEPEVVDGSEPVGEPELVDGTEPGPHMASGPVIESGDESSTEDR